MNKENFKIGSGDRNDEYDVLNTADFYCTQTDYIGCACVLSRYKGYIGTMQYDKDDNIFYGELLNVKDKDIVAYHGESTEELFKCYKNAIDNYISYQKEIENNDIYHKNKRRKSIWEKLLYYLKHLKTLSH